MTIIERLAINQPGVIVELIRRRLLSVVNARQLLGMVVSVEQALDTSMMGHDAYRRVRWRLEQVRWGA